MSDKIVNEGSGVEIDIFVGNNTLLDPEIYDMWLSGQDGKEINIKFYNCSFCSIKKKIRLYIV